MMVVGLSKEIPCQSRSFTPAYGPQLLTNALDCRYDNLVENRAKSHIVIQLPASNT
jgi:hypothetical protein